MDLLEFFSLRGGGSLVGMLGGGEFFPGVGELSLSLRQILAHARQ